MKQKQTFGNHVMVRLDKDHTSIKFKDGSDFYIDTSYEPDKHRSVIGEVVGLPSKLQYTGKPNIGMPWKTSMEVKIGDTVILYYLAVANCFRPESPKAIVDGEDRSIFITYQNIYAVVRDGKVIPVNGYCLVEPIEDPVWASLKKRMTDVGLVPFREEKKSMKDVVYGKVKYTGIPNEDYVDGHSDNGVDVKPGDIIVMKRISDIPLEYDMHAKLDGGVKYWRVQRRYILGVYEESV